MASNVDSPLTEAERHYADDEREVGYNRAWFNLIRAHRKLYPVITKALKDDGIRDPIWYEILYHLDLAGPDGQLMSELEDRLFVPQYALSRHVARMEKAGFLRRRYIADGRRKQLLSLSEKGKGAYARIWPRYVDVIRAELGPQMSIDEAYAVARALANFLP